MNSVDQLKATFEQFDVPGTCIEVTPFGNGIINDTYACRCKTPTGDTLWVMQRINHDVFTRPRQVMENIGRVTSHLKGVIGQRGGNPERETLNFASTTSGSLLYERDDKTFWRLCRLLENVQTFDVPPTRQHVYAAAHSFGQFQKDLGTLGGGRLHETIPGFHDTPLRFSALTKAVETGLAHRIESAKEMIHFALERETETRVLVSLLKGWPRKTNPIFFAPPSIVSTAICFVCMD